jgi:hypothetical protein
MIYSFGVNGKDPVNRSSPLDVLHEFATRILRKGCGMFGLSVLACWILVYAGFDSIIPTIIGVGISVLCIYLVWIPNSLRDYNFYIFLLMSLCLPLLSSFHHKVSKVTLVYMANALLNFVILVCFLSLISAKRVGIIAHSGIAYIAGISVGLLYLLICTYSLSGIKLGALALLPVQNCLILLSLRTILEGKRSFRSVTINQEYLAVFHLFKDAILLGALEHIYYLMSSN